MNTSNKIITKVKESRGESLIEVLVVIALMGIIMVPVGASLMLGLKTYQNEIAVDSIFTDQETGFTQIKDAIRKYPYNINVVNEATDSATIEIQADSGKISFYVSGGNLYRKSATQTIVLSKNITLFKIEDVKKNESGELLSFKLTVTAESLGRKNKLSSVFALDRY